MRSHLAEGYNPFDKNIGELEPDDLLVLRKVHEGWYVDYKEGPISQRGYAKAISAMANTYGGWVFIGVKERSRDDNVAGAYPGIAPDQIDQISQKIRQAVTEHLNPTPYFELICVTAPEAENTEHKVVCVHIPPSPKAPVVHSDGRIYRRVNDASEPVAENSRNAVEHLFNRSNELAEIYSDWFEKDPQLSKAEDHVSVLRVISVPDYWDEKRLWFDGSTEDFRKLLQTKSENLHFSQPYDTIYSRQSGFVCRATQPHDRRQISPTLIVHRDFRCEYWLPIPSFDVDQFEQYSPKNAALEELVEYLRETSHSDCTVLDLTQVFGPLDAFFRLQRVFQEHVGYKGTTHTKYRLKNVWRRVPLVAMPIQELGWDKYGVPMVLWDEIGSPKGGTIETFQEVDLHEDQDGNAKEFMLGMNVFLRILLACGLGVGDYDDFWKVAKNAVMTSFNRANKPSPSEDC